MSPHGKRHSLTSGSASPEKPEGGFAVDEQDLAARIQDVFNRFDKDGGGSLDKIELTNLFRTLSPSFTAKQIQLFIKQLDRGGDGSVSHPEFMAWIKAGTEEAQEFFKIILKETGDAMSNRVREVFQRFDSDGGGYLDRDELARVFRTLDYNFTLANIDALIRELDSGGDGKVSQREFMVWLKRGSDWAKRVTRSLARETGQAREERIRKAFNKYDSSGDGSLDIEELGRTLKALGSFTSDEVKKVCADLDKSKDGEISFQEFSLWIKQGSGNQKEVHKAKAILAPSDSDGLEGVFYAFCGAGHADMDGKNFKKIFEDCNLLDRTLNATGVDLIFSDPRVRPRAQKGIDFYQFEVALELAADKKGISKKEIRDPILLQGTPKPAVNVQASIAPKFAKLAESSKRGKKPQRSASEKRIAAILKAPLNEVEGKETWRNNVDNRALWKVFGLDSKAGQTLKRIYNPVPVVATPKKRDNSKGYLPSLEMPPSPTHSEGDAGAGVFLTRSVSLPQIVGAKSKA